MKKLLLALFLASVPLSAFAACTGTFAPGNVCGTTAGAGAQSIPGPLPLASFALAPAGATGNVQFNAGGGALGGYTDTQLTTHINTFTSALSGAVPASGGGTTTFLRADATFAAIAMQLPFLTTQLNSNVALSNTANFFSGPTITSPPAGTYLLTSSVTLSDTAGAARINCVLWDNAGSPTVFSSGQVVTGGASETATMSLTGIAQGTFTQFLVSCKDQTSTSGFMLNNTTGLGVDSSISAVRIQ